MARVNVKVWAHRPPGGGATVYRLFADSGNVEAKQGEVVRWHTLDGFNLRICGLKPTVFIDASDIIISPVDGYIERSVRPDAALSNHMYRAQLEFLGSDTPVNIDIKEATGGDPQIIIKAAFSPGPVPIPEQKKKASKKAAVKKR